MSESAVTLTEGKHEYIKTVPQVLMDAIRTISRREIHIS